MSECLKVLDELADALEKDKESPQGYGEFDRPVGDLPLGLGYVHVIAERQPVGQDIAVEALGKEDPPGKKHGQDENVEKDR